jgi:hypothetical protein
MASQQKNRLRKTGEWGENGSVRDETRNDGSGKMGGGNKVDRIFFDRGGRGE